MKPQHLLFYDEFDDPVLNSLHGHVPNRGPWTVVTGNEDNTHLVQGELRLDTATFDAATELFLRTPEMPADVRVEALFHFRDVASYPFFEIFARYGGGGTDYAGMLVYAGGNGEVYAYWQWDGGGAGSWANQDLAWGTMLNRDIYVELTCTGREINYKFVNLAPRKETEFHYTIPVAAIGAYRYCALRIVPNNRQGGPVEHGCKYFKVFGADKAE